MIISKSVSYIKISVLLASSFLTFFLYGCVGRILKPAPVPASLVKLSFSEHPVFVDDMDYDNLEEGIRQSLSYLKKRPQETKFKFGQDVYETSHLVDSLVNFLEFIEKKPSAGELKKYIDENYYVYKSTGSNGSGDVLFTGYYEPFLEGSLSRSVMYRYPVYGTPSDLISIDLSLFSPKYEGEKITGRYTGQTVVPYYERKEIETGGMLEGKAPVVAWVKDPVDLFFFRFRGLERFFSIMVRR